MEANPDRFMRETLPPALRAAAARLARAFGARAPQLAFVENATAGANAVLRSLDFRRGDEILITSHSYGAVRQTARYVCSRTGAKLVEAVLRLPVSGPDELVAAVESRLSGRTRLVILDHIASPTGLVFPLKRLATLARRRGAKILVDGAHAPGQIELNIPALGADWYVGNCHKWLFAPRGCAFLWARQPGIHPLAISHGYGKGFAAEFDWTGTRDFSPWLAVTEAIRFHRALQPRARRYQHQLVTDAGQRIAAAWNEPLDGPASMHASMIAIRVPDQLDDAARLRSRLLARYGVVAAIVPIERRIWCRISAQIYNTPADYDRLIEAIEAETRLSRRSRR
jgi:isopenicillin-N epimerase